MFRMLAPPPDLRPYIRFFWAMKAAGHAPPQRVIPDGCCELIWQLADSFRRVDDGRPAIAQPGAFVFGQIERAIRLESPGAIDVIGVRLAPAGAAALWGVDVSSLGPRECALTDLFPTRLGLSCDELRDIVALPAPTPEGELQRLNARCTRIARWIRDRSRRSGNLQARRAMAALECMQATSVDLTRVARSIGTSRRSVERAFLIAVGLSPATYLRLRRIDDCGRELRRSGARLSSIAAEAGYADQAHFSREFRQVVGIAPAAYRLEAGLQTPLLP